jgi:hypothetical protein
MLMSIPSSRPSYNITGGSPLEPVIYHGHSRSKVKRMGSNQEGDRGDQTVEKETTREVDEPL